MRQQDKSLGTNRPQHGGRLLIEALETQGVQRVFCVPGESYLAALDGLHDSTQIETVICRQEGGATMMADAHAKMTGEAGIAFVTRGPGATNSSIGVHIAFQDSSPMILFVGLPGRDMIDREAFQEFDFLNFFRAIAKSAEIISQTDRIPEYISRAFHTALSGRPGPVVLGLPEDMLAAAADGAPAPRAMPGRPGVSDADLRSLEAALARAQRPLMVVGGPGWSAETAMQIANFCERFDLPVAAQFRCQDYIDNRHPCYVGHAGIAIEPRLGAAIRDADLLVSVGARLDETTTSGYTLVDIPRPKSFLVHVHPGAEEIGMVYATDLPIVATAQNFARALERLSTPAEIAWRRHRNDLRAAFEAFTVPEPTPGDLKLEQVVETLNDMLPEDAIVTNGAGNYAGFVNRYFLYKGYRTQLAPTNGTMGYGLPAAIAAKLAAPEKTVVAFAGDGCFLMNGQEMATAVQYGLKLVVIVVNNGMYGTIRMHQEREYPERVHGTTLMNPDFAAMARAFGAQGETVEMTVDFRAALRRALDAPGLALIELKTDPDAISPRLTVSGMRAAAKKKV